MAERLGFDVRSCNSWQSYRESFVAANGKDDGTMVAGARNAAGYLSVGELSVLLAMLHAADFSWLADELSEGNMWRNLDYTRGEYAAAVGLAISRQ